ncbi:hypothetical protein [Kurthia senegalensis]|uniref:hypothetical protein n=1 Tax=Kurthia senegalensis TaxID=1033740 RepID=UPI00028961DA|nr:hypothetical protein [Kurthia senegalensis]
MNHWPEGVARPAIRALHTAELYCLEDLQRISATHLQRLHGIGPKAFKTLKSAMDEKGYRFVEEA